MSARRPNRKRQTPYSLHERASVAAFKAWLSAGGAEVLAPTNDYEVVRYRGAAGLSIIYANRRARPHTMTGDAQAAWAAFVNDELFDRAQPPVSWIGNQDERPVPLSAADIVRRAARDPVTIAFVMDQNAMPMREASAILFSLERDGLLTRSGGGPGSAFVWRPTAMEARP